MTNRDETEITTTTDTTTGIQITTDATSGNLPVVVFKEYQGAGSLVNRKDFTPEQIAQAKKMADQVNFDHTNTIQNFGVAPQRNLSKYMDGLLKEVNIGQAGIAGRIAEELVHGFDVLEIENFRKHLTGQTKKPGFFGRLFRFGKSLSSLIKHYQAKKDEIVVFFDKIEEMANQRSRKIQEFNNKLDMYRTTSEKYIIEVGLVIIAGEMALERGFGEFEQLRSQIRGNDDSFKASKLKEFSDRIMSFEQRLIKIKIAYTKAVSDTIPRIQIIMKSGEIEIQNLQDSILFDLVSLKEMALQVAALVNIQEAQKETEKLADARARMHGALQDLTDQAYLTSLDSQGSSLDVVKGMVELADKFAETLIKGREIEDRNRENNKQAEGSLIEIRNKVTEVLRETSKVD